MNFHGRLPPVPEEPLGHSLKIRVLSPSRINWAVCWVIITTIAVSGAIIISSRLYRSATLAPGSATGVPACP